MIVFVHLLNDLSGSPKVLASTIAAFRKADPKNPVKLYVGSQGEGHLSECQAPIAKYWYKRTPSRIFTLFAYSVSQVSLFVKLYRDKEINRDAVIYVNTLLPFGAAVFGYITKRKVVYHIHEISIRPNILKKLLVSIAARISGLNIYVSKSHMQSLPINNVPGQFVYNALPPDFQREAYESDYRPLRAGYFNVLMISSLRDYKGIREYMKLAGALKHKVNIRFELLVNGDENEISRYFAEAVIPGNVTIFPQSTKTQLFYGRAGVLLNLSRVDQWIETFGMTILEAMAFGIPTIVPPIGGPGELVSNDVEGYLIDSRNHSMLIEKLLALADNPERCLEMSTAARRRSKEFSLSLFENAIVEAVYSHDKRM